MKILFLVCELGGKNGYSTYAKNIISVLNARGYETQVVCQNGENTKYSILPDHMKFFIRPWMLLPFAWKLRSIVLHEKPDIIYSTIEAYTLLCFLLPREYQKRVIGTMHGTYAIQSLLNPFTRIVLKRIIKNIGMFVAVSDYTLQRTRKECSRYVSKKYTNLFIKKSCTIRNGIIVKNIKSTVSKTRNIIHVGGIKERKGVKECIESCIQYRDTYSDNFTLQIIGNMYKKSAYYQEVKKMIDTYSMQKNITLCGIVSDQELVDYYTNARLLLLPSITHKYNFEGFGLVYLEANMYGVPCIGPNDSGAKEAIKHGISGYSIDPRSYIEIAKAIHAILDVDKIIPSNCINWAKDNSLELRVDELEKVMNGLLAHSTIDT